MKIEFVASASASEVLAVLVNEGRAFVGTGSQLDAATSGALTRAMTASRFTGGSKIESRRRTEAPRESFGSGKMIIRKGGWTP